MSDISQPEAAASREDGAALAWRISELQEEIITQWERRVLSELPAAPRQSTAALRDSVPEFLHALARTLGGLPPKDELAEIEGTHARQRAGLSGYTLRQVLREYMILRDTLLEVLARDAYLTDAVRAKIIRAVDDAQVETATAFTASVRASKDEAKVRLQLALDAGRTTLWALDLETAAVTTSSNVSELFGVDAGEAATWSDVLARVHQEDRELLTRRLAELRQGQAEGLGLEFRVVRPNGSVRYIDARASLFRTESGGTHLSGTFTDVTERAVAERRLAQMNEELELRIRERTEFLDALLESLEDGIVACDAEGRLSLFNRATREFHGHDAEGVRYEEWPQRYDLFLSDGTTRLPAEEVPLLRAFRGELVKDVELVIAPAGRPVRRVSCSGRALYDRDGRKIGAVMAMHDVTAAHKAEEERIRRAAAEVSQARIASILESISDAFFSVDREWRITYVNRAASKVTGRSTEDLLGKVLWDEFPAALQTEIYPQLERAMRERVNVHFEAYYPAPIDAWLELNVYPKRDGLSVYYRDVTARNRARVELAQLHERERQLRLEAERRAAELDAIIDSLPDQVFIGNTQTFVRVNRPVLEMMGFDSLEELVGDDISTFPERAQIRDANTGRLLTLEETPFASALRGDSVQRELTHVNLKTGERRTFIAKSTPIRAGGEIIGGVAVHIDITEQMRASHRVAAVQRFSERGLAQLTSMSELLGSFSALLQQTFDSDTASILLLDTEGRFEVHAENGEVLSNPGAPRLPRFATRVLNSLDPLWVDDAAADAEVADEAAARGLVSLAGAPLRAHGQVVGAVKIGFRRARRMPADDLSLLGAAAAQVAIAVRHARLYAYTQQQVHDLEEERGVREQFVSALSHDLRGPLTAAQMSARLLIRKPDDVEHHLRLAHRIVDSIGRADAMIRDLLDANRIRAGQTLPLEIVSCDLGQLVRATTDEFASVHGRSCLIEAPEQLEGYWSCEGLRRILENLLSNAAKYGHPTKPIRVRLERSESEVALEVNNALMGRPLSAAECGQLFRPFVRTASAEASGKTGWGLGLALVKGLVEAHGGRIDIESSTERGTSFIIVLPLDTRPRH